MLRRAVHALLDLFGRARRERELDEEIRAHLTHQIDAYRARGLDAVEAERRARADFGAVEAIKDECRDARATRWLDVLLQDSRQALRVMTRYPSFTLTAVGTLGLTIAGVSIVTSLAYTFFLRPLPVPQGDRVVRVDATQDDGANTGPVSYPDYVHFRDRTTSLRSLAAIYPTAPLFVTRTGEGVQVNGAVASGNFFSTLGLEPARGRFFGTEEDTVPGRDRVAVVGHGFWQGWFGGRDEALGGALTVNGVEFTVIGVAPPGFTGVDGEPINVFLPTMMLPVGYRWCEDAFADDCTMLRMYGRLEADIDVEDAESELAAILPDDWRETGPGEDSGLRVEPALGAYLSDVDRRFLGLLAWASAALLAIACANLAGLLLARARTRGDEVAVRNALGAPIHRLVFQFVVESVAMAMTGGLVGLLLSRGLSHWLTGRFFAVDSSGRALAYDFGATPAVVVAVLGISALAGVAYGLVPALCVARGPRRTMAARGRATASVGRAPSLLIVAQAAAAVVMLIVAGLLTASASELLAGRGVDPERVALLRLRPRLMGYEAARAQPYLREVAARLGELPQVESLSYVGTGIAILGLTATVETIEADTRTLRTGYLEVGPRYFETLGIALAGGREFLASDDAGAPRVAIVSAAAAAELWPDEPPLGQELRVDEVIHTVVGVAADVRLQSRADRVRPYVYAPFWQSPSHIDARLQVRVKGDPEAALPGLVSTILEVDQTVPVSETLTLEQRLQGLFRPQRLAATAVAYSSALAVVLAAIGLYASLAAAVARRTKEIGIRRALGATSRRIVSSIAGEGAGLLAAGLLAGMLFAGAGIRLLAPVLYASPDGDPVRMVLAALGVAAVGLLACLVPARRAARVAPSRVLRGD